MIKIKLLFSILSLVIVTNVSNAVTLTDSLIQCNSEFFQTLYQYRAKLSKVVKIEHDKKKNAWIPVPDSKKASEQIAYFTHSIKDNNLTLVGFYDGYFDLEMLGKYYMWGFLIEEPMDKVISMTPKISWHFDGEEFIANSQIKLSTDTDWKINRSNVSGIAPAKGSAEKVVMLSEHEGKSLLLCSIQGNISSELLHQERPDIKGK